MATQPPRKRYIGPIITLVVMTVASAALFLAPRLSQPQPVPTATPTMEQMIALLEETVDKNPRDVQAQLTLGNIYFDKKEYPGAIKAYQAVLAEEPKHVNARVDMATAYYYQGNYLVAETELKMALAQEPNNVNALYNLGVVYHSMGQFPNAKALWQKASRLATDPKVKANIDERLRQVS